MPTAYILRCLGWANGLACPHEGHYVESGDHDAYNGQGYFTFTPNVNDAKRFPSIGAALDYWRKQSTARPLRPDGKPNRPLSAIHAEILELS